MWPELATWPAPSSHTLASGPLGGPYLDPGLWILDSGIQERASKAAYRPPAGGLLASGSGLWTLDSGSGLGLWTLDSGFWILEKGALAPVH